MFKIKMTDFLMKFGIYAKRTIKALQIIMQVLAIKGEISKEFDEVLLDTMSEDSIGRWLGQTDIFNYKSGKSIGKLGSTIIMLERQGDKLSKELFKGKSPSLKVRKKVLDNIDQNKKRIARLEREKQARASQ